MRASLWLDYAQSELEIKYLNALDKLLKLYSKKGDFTTLHSLSRRSMVIVITGESHYCASPLFSIFSRSNLKFLFKAPVKIG